MRRGPEIRTLRIVRVVAINTIVIACLSEITLRVQQKVGPLIDLEIGDGSLMAGLSDELNHIPVPDNSWDREGIRTMDEPNPKQCSQRILFMGDSFMQGTQQTAAGAVV